MPGRLFVATNWKTRKTGEAVPPDAEERSGS